MSTTKFCLTSDEELAEDATFPVIVAVLIIFNVLGIIAVSILIVFETRTKLKYHRVKETPPKLVLTREYLEKLRPPKRTALAVDPNTIPSIPSIPSTTNEAAPGAAATGSNDAAPKTNLAEPVLDKTQEQKTGGEEKKK
uniref:Uncharacterized protein n=1 Tax=Panagrolaimus superbus TaxID=310955 RepID=A0A914YGY1_9BILA